MSPFLKIEKFKQSVGRPVSANIIWDKLKTLYALDMLEETEISPLQEEKDKNHFSLHFENVTDSPRFFNPSEFEISDKRKKT